MPLRLGDNAPDLSARTLESTEPSTGGSMSPDMDPEAHEVTALRALGSTGPSRTLEIGVGDGRLMRRLQAFTSPVTGIDSSLGSMALARKPHPARPRIATADARRLPFCAGGFDQVVFGWSL